MERYPKFLTIFEKTRTQKSNYLFILILSFINIIKGDFLGIYSINREEWPIAALACTLQGIIIVPLYDTLGTL